MFVAPQMRRTRLVIADRHPIVLHGLISVITAQQDFEIVASCTSGRRSVEALRNLAPDVALLGDSLPDVTASEFLAIANAENLPTRLVFFTSSLEQGDLASAIADGACSGISKYASPETLLRSLRLVMEGISLLPELSPELASPEKESGANIEELLTVLTDREREIMRLVAEGLSNKEIARQLNVSDGTIKVHLHHIYQKLEINSRTVLAALVLSQRHGGFGMLSLAALTFATMPDAKAADPGETILDDDNIAYKDLEYGAFELWTKEDVPRHIVVNDPGQTIVLTGRGSSVSVSQVANSAARMEELQAAQQAVLANVAKGYGPNGSSSPPHIFNLPGAQQLDEVQPGGPTTPGSLPPLEFAPNPIFYPLIAPPLPPEPPSLNAASGPMLIDTGAFDDFAASSGNFVASSPRPGATLTFGIDGGTAGSTVLDGVTYDTSKTGPYGTLYLDSATGAYIYVPDDDAINALAAPTIESFIITVSDGTLAASQIFTVTIDGGNDAAIITGVTGGGVTEAGGVANAAPGTLTATGTLTDTDVDNPANTFTAVNSPTPSQKGYGTFTMTVAGVWTYTLDNGNPEVQALNVGGTLIDTFIVTTVDGTPQIVTITITGSNDAAIISGTTSGSVLEAGSTAPGTPVATGTLTDVDVDNVDNAFIAVISPTAGNNGYGTFTMTAAGVWTYTLDNGNAEVQSLNVGGTLIDTFIVTTVDGTAQIVTITITGSNDAAIISGTTAGSVLEAGSTAPGTPVATGTLSAADADNAANAFIAVIAPTASNNGYGTFTMTAAGVWTYTLDNGNPEVQALNVGGTLTDSFIVTTVDGTAQAVTITITGSNDAAVISGTASGSVVEAGADPGTPVATGTLTDTDVDNEDNAFIAVTSPTASSKGYGTFMMTAAGAWTYMLDNANAEVEALDPGETLTDTFTVTTIDGTTQVVTIVIHGSSDADPNDFDHLALGTEVVSDPPFVYGTPDGETIAGGGNEPQTVYAGAGDDTVNGTGVDDVLYSGSGNDTIKGNGGDDTLYGGSGRDDINGNNGSDTIIGGYGADDLTGSNGDDVFVYLAVADSNSSGFDRITDFASGSDKINLAAFGALAFLHLTSASTSVPPRTIAWIYDSASNETIVYVNPTDEVLDIGDPALLEIHLQGVVSVAESDFIHEEATATTVVTAGEAIDPALAAIAAAEIVVLTSAIAEVSAESEDGVSAHAGSWTLQATEESFKFDFDRGVDSIGSIRIARFGEASAYATAASDGEAVTALVSGPPIELWHDPAAAPVEEHFTLQAGPAAGATAASHAAAMPPSDPNEPAAMANAVAAAQLAEQGVTPGNGANPHPQHEPQAALEGTGPNNPHSASSPPAAGNGHQTAAVNPGHAEVVPGQGHSSHFNNGSAASHQAEPGGPEGANPASAQGLAHGHGAEPGGPAEQHAGSHAQIEEPGKGSSHFNNAAASSNHADPIEPGSSSPASAPGIAHGHGAGPDGPAAIVETKTAAPAPAQEPAASILQNGVEPGQGGSFHFNNAATPSNHADPVELTEAGPAPGSVTHEHGAGPVGPAAIQQIIAELSQPEEPAAAHAHVAPSQAASHGAHELIV
ncbi:VCBS domain-containing protein [Bradyrhizobium sp.]|uniref:VCBS domain-containing protein n=1 Tax=Bradyrhizobium sp. TaxID=376 RepID=UPI004037AA0A